MSLTENASPTQTGVLDEPTPQVPQQDEQQKQPEPAEPPKSARELAIEAITAQRNAQFEREADVKLESKEQPAPTPEEKAEPKTELDEQLQKQLEEPKPRVVKLKVEGQEIEMPEDQVIEIAQKNLAADRRLRDATQMLKDAEEKAKAVQTPPVSSAPPAPEQPKQDKAALIERAKKIVSATLEGREDDAAAELADLLVAQPPSPASGTSAPQLDVEQVSAHVLQKLSNDRALAQSQQDYPELYSDPLKNRFGATLIQEAMAQGKPFVQALQETGEVMAKTFGWKTPGRQQAADPQPRNPKPSESKQEKKATIDVVAGVNATSASNEEPPQTASERIAEIAKARQPWLYK